MLSLIQNWQSKYSYDGYFILSLPPFSPLSLFINSLTHSFPSFLPPSLSLHPSLLSFLPSFLPFFLPTFLPPFLPTFLPSFLLSFLPSLYVHTLTDPCLFHPVFVAYILMLSNNLILCFWFVLTAISESPLSLDLSNCRVPGKSIKSLFLSFCFGN